VSVIRMDGTPFGELPSVDKRHEIPDSAYADEEKKHVLNHPPKGASQWAPPSVVTYGASFDPAAIPLREWIITGRYARGEGTAIAGPPGVNKSSLLLTDAVQIITGRSLIGDHIAQSGAVLMLVGEDRRRDFEARLAALCVHFHIAAADLKDRLHVVYQTEMDPATYTLGNMVRDIAVLNTSMLKWLREYPDVSAIFIDPMASWHNFIENNNDVMGVLVIALRNLAAQTNRAVAFDHHVTKLAMADEEAHVHNLAAMRGGTVIVAQMRWAYTMSKLNAASGTRFGIADEDRWLYRRLDSLKASYGPDGDDPRLLKVEVVTIANTERVGILTPVDSVALAVVGKQRKVDEVREWNERLTDALGRMLMDASPVSTLKAAQWLLQHEPTIFQNKKGEPLADATVRKRLPGLVGNGQEWRRAGGSYWIICRTSGKGNGERHEIDFRQEGDL
jgi:AAA domain